MTPNASGLRPVHRQRRGLRRRRWPSGTSRRWSGNSVHFVAPPRRGDAVSRRTGGLAAQVRSHSLPSSLRTP